MTHTIEDLERVAYINGDTDRAALLARIAELEKEVVELEDKIGDTDRAALLARIAELEKEVVELEDKIGDTETLEDWEKNHGSAQEYYDFFHACFECLGGHYPCPEVSSAYDCSVIFKAIEAGEAARQENEGD